MDSLAYSTVSFLVTLGILITVHEFGHFGIARILGVRVLRFSVGFGPVVWKKVGAQTGIEYTIGALPLGGYVRMLDESEGHVVESDLPRAFNRQPLWIRSAIVVAGPLSNILFAAIALWLVLVVGDVGLRPLVGGVQANSSADLAGFKKGDAIVAVGNQTTQTWDAVALALMTVKLHSKEVPIEVVDAQKLKQTRWLSSTAISQSVSDPNILEVLGFSLARPVTLPKIGGIVLTEPAAVAGLEPGNLILSADGQSIGSWYEWVEYVRLRPGVYIHIKVQRQSDILDFNLQPRPHNENGQIVGRIGASVDMPADLDTNYWVVVRMGPLDALVVAVQKTIQLCQVVINELGRMFLGQGGLDRLSGPISIAQIAGKAASYGLNPFLKFLASISISLGVLNLFPIPVLDGGYLLFFLIEGIAGRPLPMGVQVQLLNIGTVLLLLLTILIFGMDVMRLLG